jgi:NAD(P)-dependent dehydrogenase (short-subunit alcohol dehydrogenase family)
MSTIKDLGNLSGRRALITGATGALGKVFAESLAELGADLVLVDLPGSNFETLSKGLVERWAVKVDHHACDLEIQVQRDRLVSDLVSSDQCLNILVNNAAFVGTTDLPGWNVPFGEQSIDTWRRAFEVNLTATFDLCQRLLPLLKNSTGANIVNIASIYGMHGPDWSLYEDMNMSNPAAYSASKGGLIQLTRWLATTLSPDVRVNAISPGGIFRNQPKEFVKRYELKTPLARMANEEDFRGAISFLTSDLSKYVTGQVLSVDGGWGIW